MNADTLLENFEILAEAPGGIDRLRELILKMAVSGKLVEQFQDDGDAGELIPKYVANQKQMTDDGVIGTQRFQRGSNSPQLPYHIPKNWRWHYLGDVGAIIGGGTPSSSVSSYWSDHDSVPWLTPADMRKLSSRYVMRGRRDITPKGLTESSAQLLPSGAVLFSSRAPIGHVAIAAQPLATNQGFKSCVPYIAEMNEYIYFFLLQIGPQVDANATGTTFKEVSGKQVAQILIPVPPLAEQRRIVARVDELMALCDQLEQQQRQRNNLRIATRKSAIDAISTASTPEELETAWKRIENYWEVIADTPESIESLRSLILGLAVTDRLVDSSNSQLSKQVMSFESPTNIWATFSPKGWKCLSLEDASDQITDGTHQTPNYVETGIPFLSIKDISSGKLDFSRTRFISPKEHKKLTERVKPQRGDVLICRIGTLGRAISVDTDEEFSIFVSLGLVRPKEFVNPKFLAMLLNSPISYQQFDAIKAGGSHTVKLNLGSLRKYVLWIPPLNVQELILSKIDELMMLCDQLEVGLKARSEFAEKFARSVVSAA